ncbi:hypothetical protein HY407_02030 [Candidatus Gottesmanbacteria bacterium]|nr:hypothetical protein [Candidatus Gottesmanbacteria bacterium]
MNKKVVIGIIIVIVLAGLAAGGYFFIKGRSITSPIGQSPQSIQPMEEFTTWKDPMGFTFEYPKDFMIDNHEEDEENYAHVELTKSGLSGNIIIWAKDTTYTSLDGWLKGDKEISGGNSVDTTWGGKEAKKVRISAPAPKVVTATLYDDIIFLLEENPDGAGKLDAIYEAILENFKFYEVSATGETIPAKDEDTEAVVGDSGTDEGYVDEEVVE